MSKKAIVGIIAGAILILLFIVAIVTAINDSANSNDDTSSKQDDTSKVDTPKQDTTTDVKPITATVPLNFRAVCVGGSIENAAEYAKPYRLAVFENNRALAQDHLLSVRDHTKWELLGVSSVNENTPEERGSKYTELTTVLCLDRDDSTAVKATTCDFKFEGKTISIDYYSVKYKATLYEARTGDKITELEAINGTATTCPAGASFDQDDPKFYADPDLAELNERVAPFEG
jgi:hypothetical protein